MARPSDDPSHFAILTANNAPPQRRQSIRKDTHDDTVCMADGRAAERSLGLRAGLLCPKNIDWGETASSDVVRTESAPKITVNRNATPATATVTDGNKRLAITLSAQFLLLNGYMAVAKDLFVAMENISYQVAAGKIDRWQN